MPIYEYRCKVCGEKFEVYRGYNDEEKAICPECSSRDVERVFSTFGSKCSSCSPESVTKSLG